MAKDAGMTNETHGRPAGSEPSPLGGVAAPSHAERARTLLASSSTGTLCTLAREPAGYPYGSLITFGLDAGEPVFLISELAEHTRNLHADARASLLVAESRAGDPLALGRVTLLGSCARASDAQRQGAREAYLSRHPGAAGYAGFADFSFWRLAVSAVRYIGGYGRMSWIEVDAWRSARPDPIAPEAAAILEHMNQDHADALPLYCRAFTELQGVSHVTMTGIDRLGFEMSVTTPSGTQTVRLPFSAPIADKTDARKSLVALLREARARLGVA
jgi:heme oxygenase (biliverdin-IX-beta and delta-forming)